MLRGSFLSVVHDQSHFPQVHLPMTSFPSDSSRVLLPWVCLLALERHFSICPSTMLRAVKSIRLGEEIFPIPRLITFPSLADETQIVVPGLPSILAKQPTTRNSHPGDLISRCLLAHILPCLSSTPLLDD
jgi:hypothetical protein